LFNRRQLAAGALGLAFLPRGARAQQPAVAAIGLVGQRVLIQAELNGRGPFPFVIDTGSVYTGIREALARELGLRASGAIRLNQDKLHPVYAVRDLVLGGGVRQRNVGFFGLQDGNLGGEGLIAAGLLTSLDSELDFEAGQWRVYPQGAPARPDYTPLDTQFQEPGNGLSLRMFSEVVLDGVKMRALLDTGEPMPLSIDHDVGVRLGLTAAGAPYAPWRGLRIDGPDKSVGRLTRAKTLTIGGAAFAAPLIAVRGTGDTRGHPTLGLPFIRTLNLKAQRRPARLWVKRNALEPTTPPYNCSGLWLDAAADEVVVSDVGAGSPAAEAGVRVGDVVEGAGGLRQALDAVGGRPGTRVELKLRGGGGSRDVAFVLRAYL
jgi:serine protease Do